jgi:hypothetical protein
LHSSFIELTNLYSFHSSNPIDQKKVLHESYLGVAVVAEEEVSEDGGSGDRQEEGGIDGSGDDWQSRERWELRERRGLREFLDEQQNDTGRATIYRFRNISSGSGLKLLLIVLKSRSKQFWFQTAADEGIISSGSKLEPLLISWPLISNDLRSWTIVDMWSGSGSRGTAADRAHPISIFLVVPTSAGSKPSLEWHRYQFCWGVSKGEWQFGYLDSGGHVL